MPALVSVCIPTWNSEKFIRHCVESVINQTHQDLELIVADDGSTDDTIAIIRSYAEQDSRIVLHRNERRLGIMGNFNRCAELARAPFIKILCHDDFLEPTALEKQLAVFKAQPGVVLVSSAKKHLDETGGLLSVSPPHQPETLVPGIRAISDNLRELQNLVGLPSAVLFRSGLPVRGFDARYFCFGDLDYWFQLLEHGDYFGLAQPLCSVRLHPGTGTALARRSLLFLCDFLRLKDEYRDTMTASGMSEAGWNQLVDNHMRACCAGIWSEGEPDAVAVAEACLHAASGTTTLEHVLESLARLALFGGQEASSIIPLMTQRDSLLGQVASLSAEKLALEEEISRLRSGLPGASSNPPDAAERGVKGLAGILLVRLRTLFSGSR